MPAMILAAGRGERLRPLTDTTPKALIEVQGERLVDRHLRMLAAADVKTVVINLGWLGEQIVAHVGSGQQFGLQVIYSPEYDNVLETGGGMLHALGLLGPNPFLVVNADIITDFLFARLPEEPAGLAHLVMVDNPKFHPRGDFVLIDGQVTGRGPNSRTFAGIGVYRPQLLIGQQPGCFSVVPLLE